MVFLFAALTFLATFLTALIAVAIAWMWLQKRAGAAAESGAGAANLAGSTLLRDDSLSTISIWDWLLARFDFVERLQTLLAEADADWSVGRVTALMLLLGAVALALVNSFDWVPGWAGLLATVGAASLPYVYLRHRRAKRLALFCEQFPEVLDSMASSLRAGHPVVASMYLVGQEFAAPSGPEFRRAFEECKFGQPLNDALDNLAKRVPVIELSLLCAAIQLQSRTGGNLGEVLGRLAETVREASSLQGEIKSIASHGKLTGTILTVLPLVIVAIMLYMNPNHFDVLLRHPYGKHLIAAAVACLILAHVIIGRIVDIKI